MNINYPILIAVIILVAVLIAFLIKRNRKDKKKYENEIIDSEIPPKEDKLNT